MRYPPLGEEGQRALAASRALICACGGTGPDGKTRQSLPGEAPCLRCRRPEAPPPPGVSPTCDTAGILAPIINVIASLQASEAIKILSGHREATSRVLTVFELWDN